MQDQRFRLLDAAEDEDMERKTKEQRDSETVVLDAAPGRVDQDADGAHAGSQRRLGPCGLYQHMLS